MNRNAKVLSGMGALIGLLVCGGTAEALTTITVNKCLAGKIKAEGKGTAAYLGCHSKGAAQNTATDGECLDKAGTKLVTAFSKLDAKGGCTVPGDGPSRDTDVGNHALDVDASVGHAGKCDAAKEKLAGKFVAAKMGCYAKAAGKLGSVDVDCVAKAEHKLVAGVFKAEAKGGCTHFNQDQFLLSVAMQFIDEQTCLLSPANPGCAGAPTPTRTTTPTRTMTPLPTPTLSRTSTPTPTATPDPALCGNGLNDFAEPCDESAPSAGWATCGQDFTCVSCNCACPTRVHFAGDASDPATILDTGWTGIAHRAPVISSGDVTVALSCPGGGTARSCGVCTVSGPIANTGPSELRNQRCTGDTSVQCTSAPGGLVGCGGPLGTCEFFFGAPLALVSGGVGTCVENIFNGPVSGTADIESGTAATTVLLTARVHAPVISTDTPCPICFADPVDNDGLLGGTCMGGPRDGSSCDGNGNVPGRPDFGTTSFDCPPQSATIAVLPIDFSNTTGTASKTITGFSPTCTGGGLPAGTKCACDTCNNANAQPCDSNADCPISGGNPGICGGRRCIGGTNAGAPCTNPTHCPGGGSCARPGEPTRPNGCIDNCFLPGNGTLCVDTAPIGDNEGECPHGPPTGICSASSGHAQRACTYSNECCDDAPDCILDPPTPGECLISNRLCFLDNGLGGTIAASGMSDPPVQDTSNPTLAALFCIGPTFAPAVNIAAGLPGQGRTTITGTATGHP